jgi:hypothetical protein
VQSGQSVLGVKWGCYLFPIIRMENNPDTCPTHEKFTKILIFSKDEVGPSVPVLHA